MYQFTLKWFLIQSKLQHQQQILNYNLVIEVVEITFDCKFLTSSSLCEWKMHVCNKENLTKFPEYSIFCSSVKAYENKGNLCSNEHHLGSCGNW